MEIRKAKLADVDALVILYDQLLLQQHQESPEYFLYPVVLSDLADYFFNMFDNKSCDIYIADVNGVICGYTFFQQQSLKGTNFTAPNSRIVVRHTVVDIDYRRRGIAKALSARVEEIAREREITKISSTSLVSNNVAHQYLQSRGFKVTQYSFGKTLF